MAEPRNKYSLRLEIEGDPTGMTFLVSTENDAGFKTFNSFQGDMVYERVEDVAHNALRPIARELELYLRQQRKKGH